MYYIQENDKPENFYQNCLEFFQIVKLNQNTIEIPNLNNVKKKNKIAKKTLKILSKTNCNKILISKNIHEHKEYVNYLYGNNIDIVDGKYLFTILAPEIIIYLIEKQNLELQSLNIGILINDLTTIKQSVIKHILYTYKKVNIVSSYFSKFEKLKKELYEEGIAINLSNNKKKSIETTNIILNFDFSEEQINKFKIDENAIIINFEEKIRIYKKRFNGILISDYEINVNNEKKEELYNFDYRKKGKYYLKELYESQTFRSAKFENVCENMIKEGVKIKYLEGNNIRY